MNRRSPLFRFVTLAWASLQLASPALASWADGRQSMESASSPQTHVEATTSDGCPVVHSPDCGLCRYLSASQANAEPATISWIATTASELVGSASVAASSGSVALPFGRAPPTL